MRQLLLAGCLAVLGCATSSTGAANLPKPSSNKSPSPAVDAGGGGRGALIAYRPAREAAYSIHRTDSLTVHLPGGQTQQQSLDRTAYVRMMLTEGVSANGYRVTIVLDSLQALASAIAVAPESIAVARGTRWTATVGPTGHLLSLAADRSTTLGDQLTNHLRLLFPFLPTTGARAGMTWADSARFPLKADVFNATEQAATSYRAMDDARGVKIESNGTYTMAGKGVQFDQQLEMTAVGKRQGVHYLDRDGVLASADGTETSEMNISVPAVGQTAPVTQLGRYQIRLIRR